ncbi:MAG: diaminopimelate decarboxylase [Bryobacteraceae bacterium]|nr:diaminopimelate decarboxylase [Bryobacteraceae bacterium]
MRNPYAYQNNELYCDQVPLAAIAAAVGTPCYVYSRDAILRRYREYDEAFGAHPHQVCFAVKANSNLAVLALLARAGAGFDLVSGGELYRVLAAGGDPAKVVFSGVGKTDEEFAYGLESGIHSFNCESPAELVRLSAVAARLGHTARVALRVNPDVDAVTHPYISTGLSENKFGIGIAEVEQVYAHGAGLPGLSLIGVSSHIGSQLLDAGPLEEALGKMLALIGRLRGAGFTVSHLDIGGGLGVPYEAHEQRPPVAAFIQRVCERTAGLGLTLMTEPGRSIVAEAGALVTRVLYRKQNGQKQFVIVDAAMNDLIRPSLYRAHHEILPLRESWEEREPVDVVGPVCESGDFFAKDRRLTPLDSGDLAALLTAGAYGMVLSSNYNSRPRVPEVLVEDGTWRVIRERETYADLVRGESL